MFVLEAPCIPLLTRQGGHATSIRCRVGGKPLWCLCHDSHTEIVIKSTLAATLTHTNMMPSVSPAALQTTIHCQPSHCRPLRLTLFLARCGAAGPVCVFVCNFYSSSALSFSPFRFKTASKDWKKVLFSTSPFVPFINISLLSDW